MSGTNWPGAERFENCIQREGGVTMDSAVAALDAADYWPAPRPVSYKRAHVRWMMRTMADKDGRRRWFMDDRNCEPKEEREPDKQEEAVVKIFASKAWQTLEEIRQKLAREGAIPPGVSELEQVRWLEVLFGTECKEGMLVNESGIPLVLCHIDGDVVDPEPVYKVLDLCLRDEFFRYIGERESRLREAKDDIRTLRAAMSELQDEQT